MSDWRRTARWVALAGLGASLLTACTVSVSGGLFGAVASVAVTLLLLALAGGAQTGCIEDPSPDDAEVSACLSADAAAEPDVSACLGTPIDDDATVGPCLSRLPPDAGRDMLPDVPIGPCLEPEPPPIPDAEVDQGADMAPDAEVGPCLDPPAPDPEPPGKAMRTLDTGAIYAKVRASLPPDVAARLVRPPEDV